MIYADFIGETCSGKMIAVTQTFSNETATARATVQIERETVLDTRGTLPSEFSKDEAKRATEMLAELFLAKQGTLRIHESTPRLLADVIREHTE